MMNLLQQYRTAIAFVAIVLVLFAGYSYFFAEPDESALTVTETPGAGVDQDLVALLFELRSIRLDNALFVDPIFQSLQDFGKELVPEPIGRQNPFAPLGESASISSNP